MKITAENRRSRIGWRGQNLIKARFIYLAMNLIGMTVRVGVAGACGRMGRGIVQAIFAQDDMELVLAVDVNNVGSDIGVVCGVGKIGVPVTSPENLAETLDASGADVLVDFTHREAAIGNIEAAAGAGVSLVIGTTGFEKEELERIEGLLKENKVSAVISPNMATGVNLFFKLVRDAAKAIGSEYDIEIIEAHHRNKKDSPSGTALRAGELAAEAVGRSLDDCGVFGRGKGVIGARTDREIGFHAVRAGDIIGDHTVLFAGGGERIEITHRAHSRDAFVNGVIRAVRFLAEQGGEGRVYTTWDVLGIE
ncbi:4-hydroxy-tetrahydrodipicolinate reductase [archaeon BMS3Abin16]|nr:4-hydroxy-tetrahydrodipicolinate reductase [archaeon BMS3Abin16]